MVMHDVGILIWLWLYMYCANVAIHLAQMHKLLPNGELSSQYM